MKEAGKTEDHLTSGSDQGNVRMRVRMRGAEALLRVERILPESPSQKPKMLGLQKKTGRKAHLPRLYVKLGVELFQVPGSH